MQCNLCPRRCGVEREVRAGVCGVGDKIRVARAMLHMWEEPPISGERGSGAIFFSGCSLGCVYCQNRAISHERYGKEISEALLADMMLDLQAQGAHNINLVTPTHYADKIRASIDLIRDKLKIPVVYNTSGYELPEEIAKMAGYVDIFLTDIKYYSSEASRAYSSAGNYFEYAIASLKEMLKIAPECTLGEDGMMKKGVIVRHMVLPSLRADSIRVLDEVARVADVSKIRLSLMSQYTPEFCPSEYGKLKRKITTFEYQSVVKHALELGFEGYIQEMGSANASFTPKFKND